MNYSCILIAREQREQGELPLSLSLCFALLACCCWGVAAFSLARNMATLEPQVVAISIARPACVGHLLTEPTMVNCPACEHFQLSVVELEAVSCLQRLLAVTKLW